MDITRGTTALRGTLRSLGLCGIALLAAHAAPSAAQFKLQQTFETTTAPGWSLSSSALLTAPTIDSSGAGWLRLTAALGNEKGLAIDNAYTFAGSQPVVVEFNYVAWGGSGADGMTLFLYDPTTTSPMNGAVVGGGLGYCGGAGGYLAIGLDEYGNFSNPGDKCLTASGGPGFKPESLVLRGPLTAHNAWVTTTQVPGGIDNPHATARPSPKTVLMSLTPAVAPAVGYTITVQYQSATGQPFQTLFSNVSFAYAPPATLAVGFSGATGGSTNIHELHGLVTASPDDLQVAVSAPATVVQGGPVTYSVTVTNNGSYPIGSADAPTLVDTLPASIIGVTWTCAGAGGATCEGSGSGSLDTADMTLPANASVTYTLTGTLDPAATCGTTLADTASADFGSGSTFLDPDETNNQATADSTVTCDVTLVANPASLPFGAQTENVASAATPVRLTEGVNNSAITSIVTTGDYTQTNDCGTALAGSQTCTIDVVFTPTAEGTRSGTLTILSNATASPTVTTVVSLTGTGTNAVPTSFSFTALSGVDPSSVQVSNAITVANTNVPSPISVSTGAQYSINGGAFTAVAGVVSPGAQVRVQVAAAAAYSTPVTAVLSIGGIESPFTVTTGAQPAPQGTFTAASASTLSSVQTSNPITVTGTLPEAISISSGALYSINGGAFTSATGVVAPGDQVQVQMTSSSYYGTTENAVLTIGGVETKFSVTTAAQLQNAVVTAGGGGAFDATLLLFLALLVVGRAMGPRRLTRLVPLGWVGLGVLVFSTVAHADDGWRDDVYAGARLGGSSSSMSASKLTSGLEADGYQVRAASTERSSISGTLYLGYDLPKDFAVELAWSYLGRTRAALEGTVPRDLNRLLADAAHIVRGAGDIVSLEGRYRWSVAPRTSVDLRAGPYLWITRTDVIISGATALSRTDTGPGFTAGAGPRFALTPHLGVGLSADYFASTTDNHFWRVAASAEYHF